ncbi:MAG: TIGR00266 family protein [Acidobacteria bacterium]|nr:MAG: TIGR00266 family protein [Acidobacteriota bacterium]
MANGQQWYMAIGGRQVGPVAEEEIISNLRNGSIDAKTLLFTAGMTNWTPLREVPQFGAYLDRGPAPSAPAYSPPAAAQPPYTAPAAQAYALPAGRRAHEIDYTISGEEMQFVEVELDPGESAIAEAGTMMYMTQGIQLETIFGDGSGQQQSGLMGALLGAGKRVLTGESLFMTVFTNQGYGKQRVAFAAPYAGKILVMDLSALGGQLICQKDSFLCAAKGVSIGIAFQKKIGVGLFGGEGFIMQRLEGDGICFVHAGGTVHSLELQPGETLRVDTGCLVALQPSVNYDIQFVGKIKTALFGGEGLFFATLTGPGKVWLQSLPLSRLADRIYKAAPSAGGSRKGEGSVLDHAFGLGKLIDGD